MNEELKNTLQISTRHNSHSHMWTAADLGEYLEFLGIELRRKRMKHDLPASARAMIMMDKAPQHGSATFKKLRERFESNNNCILIHGGSEEHVTIPAGRVSGTCNVYVYIYIYTCICCPYEPLAPDIVGKTFKIQHARQTNLYIYTKLYIYIFAYVYIYNTPHKKLCYLRSCRVRLGGMWWSK